MDSFEEKYNELKSKEEILRNEFRAARKEALVHVQSIITKFKLQESELEFSDVPVKKVRAAAKVKYATPDGSITWTGKGQPKKELVAWCEEHGVTLESLKIA